MKKLQEYIEKKEERQSILKNRKQELELLTDSLKDSKIAFLFGSTYLYSKRIICFILGIILISFALFLLITPSKALEYPTITNVVSLEKTQLNSALNYPKINPIQKDSLVYYDVQTVDKWMKNSNLYFKKSITDTTQEQLTLSTKITGFLILIIALLLLYISRLIQKNKKYHSKISDTRNLAKKIVSDYQKTIEEEQQELEFFSNIEEEKNNLENNSPPETPIFFKL